MQQKFLTLAAVGGVTFNQLKDGSIRVFVNATNALRFKMEVLRLANELDRYMVDAAAAPVIEPANIDRVRQLETELAALKNPQFPSVKEMTFPPVAVMPLAMTPPGVATAPIVPPTQEEINNTIVSGGFEGGDDFDLGPPPASI